MQWLKFGVIPERFNGHKKEISLNYYLLRPEFIESTYYLYRATLDPFFLDTGKRIVEDINSFLRTSCGFVPLVNVENREKGHRMESFFLGETLKYLYLLFNPGRFNTCVVLNG
jgi:hypothetical protein